MVREEFYLDWRKDTLEGWEASKSGLLIAAMIEGIKLEHEFPAVNVVKIEDNFYRLAYGGYDSCGFDDGGHHRAVAHYIEGKPLRCNLLMRGSTASFIPISKIAIEDYKSNEKIRDSLGRLPLDVSKRFCEDYDLRF